MFNNNIGGLNEENYEEDDFDDEINNILTTSIINAFTAMQRIPVNSSLYRQYISPNSSSYLSFETRPLDILSIYDSLLNIDSSENQMFENFLNQTLDESIDLSTNKCNKALEIDSIKYKNLDNKEKYEKSCSICITEYDDDSDVSVLKCNHLFHNSCIIEWSMYKTTCPVCRNDLN
jgi:hypothetical protein